MQILTAKLQKKFLEHLAMADNIDISAICRAVPCADADYKYSLIKDAKFAAAIETTIKAKFNTFRVTRLAIGFNIQVKALKQIPKELEEQSYEQIEEIYKPSVNAEGKTIAKKVAEKKTKKMFRASQTLLLQIGKNVLPELFGESSLKVKPMELPSLFDEIEEVNNDVFDYSNLTTEERKQLNELLSKSTKQS